MELKALGREPATPDHLTQRTRKGTSVVLVSTAPNVKSRYHAHPGSAARGDDDQHPHRLPFASREHAVVERRVVAAEIDERPQLLDARQAPVGGAGEFEILAVGHAVGPGVRPREPPLPDEAGLGVAHRVGGDLVMRRRGRRARRGHAPRAAREAGVRRDVRRLDVTLVGVQPPRLHRVVVQK